jgi:predicted nuclease with TOPRIM domain
MIKLDQVQLLENRVEMAVARIAELTSENNALKRQNEELAKKNAELDEFVSLLEEDQSRIEETIQRTLTRLNEVEDTVHQTAAMSAQPSPSYDQGQSPAVEQPVYEQAAQEQIAHDQTSQDAYTAHQEPFIEPSFESEEAPQQEYHQEQQPEQLDIF